MGKLKQIKNLKAVKESLNVFLLKNFSNILSKMSQLFKNMCKDTFEQNPILRVVV